jgi:hypothetical protein
MSKIFAKVFEHVNYAGQYRYIKDDISNFGTQLGFNDKVSSIIVYKGNSYTLGDKIRFFVDSFSGGYMDLEPGYYPNIHVQPFSFGDKITSADILPYTTPAPAITVRLMVRVYEHVNYSGQFRDLLTSESNFERIGFNDKVSSLRVMAGEDYAAGWVCDFYQHANYAGGMLQPGAFGPGINIANISAAPYSFNDIISSVKIYHQS